MRKKISKRTDRGSIVMDDRIGNKDYSVLWLDCCRNNPECTGFYTSNGEINEIILCNSGKHKYPQLQK